MTRKRTSSEQGSPERPSKAELAAPARGRGAKLISIPHRLFGRLFSGVLPGRARRIPSASNATPNVDKSLDSVTRALSSEDASARMLALEVILGFSEDRAAGLLAAVVHDPDPAVSRAAMSAAARLGHKRVISSLILAFDDPDPGRRAQAMQAFDAITGKTLDRAEIEDAGRRPQAIARLKSWWKRERLAELTRGLDRT